MPDELHRVVPEKRSESIVQNHRVRRSGSRRQALIALFVVLVIGGVLVGAYFVFTPHEESYVLTDYDSAVVRVETLQDTVEISGNVASRSNATVTAPEAGFVRRLLVAEGDWVTAGQLIVQIDAETLQGELDSQQRGLDQKRREYDRFLLEHQYEMRRYDREATNLQRALDEAQTELQDIRELREIGSATRSEVDDAESAVSDAQDAIADHDAEVEEAVALHELSKQNYEDDIAAAREEIADVQDRLTDTAIRAPISGRVTSVSDAATVSGELFAQYQTILSLADTRSPVVETELEEQYVPFIAQGDTVAVEVAGVRMQGTIERIGQVASTSGDGGTPTVELEIAIDSSTGEVLPGSSALVEVLIGEVNDAMVLPRGPYLTSGNRRYLYRLNGTTGERIAVEFGEITDDRVQVVSGVEPGDRIITSSYQSFLDFTTIQTGDER